MTGQLIGLVGIVLIVLRARESRKYDRGRPAGRSIAEGLAAHRERARIYDQETS